jgi:hypothetical protein
MYTVACVLVQDARAFAWLGHQAIIKWCLHRLRGVRGVDHIVCCVVPELLDKAKATLIDVDVVSIPKNLITQASMATVDNWLCSVDGPANEADIALAVHPMTPFLSTARIEQCLTHVSRGRSDSAITVQQHDCLVVEDGGRINRKFLPSAVGGCRAFKPAALPEGQPLTRNFKQVKVTSIEALDLSNPDNVAIAQALVTSGAHL